MPPVLDPINSKVDGLTFLGLSLARNHYYGRGEGKDGKEGNTAVGVRRSVKSKDGQKLGHPDSYTHQTAFDLNQVIDRDYEFLQSTDDNGWLVGGGEAGPPTSYKLPLLDSAHVEILRVGTYRKDWGGIDLKELLRVMLSGSILIPQIEVLPTDVVANPDLPPELEIRFDMEESTRGGQQLKNLELGDFEAFCRGPLPINWQLRFLHNQFFKTFVYPSRFCPGAFHSTILRKADFRSEAHRAAYFTKCTSAIKAWRRDGPKPLNAIPRHPDTRPLSPEEIKALEETKVVDKFDRLLKKQNSNDTDFVPPTKAEEDAMAALVDKLANVAPLPPVATTAKATINLAEEGINKTEAVYPEVIKQLGFHLSGDKKDAVYPEIIKQLGFQLSGDEKDAVYPEVIKQLGFRLSGGEKKDKVVGAENNAWPNNLGSLKYITVILAKSELKRLRWSSKGFKSIHKFTLDTEEIGRLFKSDKTGFKAEAIQEIRQHVCDHYLENAVSTPFASRAQIMEAVTNTPLFYKSRENYYCNLQTVQNLFSAALKAVNEPHKQENPKGDTLNIRIFSKPPGSIGQINQTGARTKSETTKDIAEKNLSDTEMGFATQSSFDSIGTIPTTAPEDCHSGIWLFTDRANITHFFPPNFLPPYDTPGKRRIIFDVLKEEWDEKTLSWKPCGHGSMTKNPESEMKKEDGGSTLSNVFFSLLNQLCCPVGSRRKR